MKKILIADDHSIVRIGTAMLIKEVLSEQVAITEAATFEKTLLSLKEGDFDLVLLDINIPGGNNIDMINAIKIRSTTPILVFSSYDEQVFALRYIKAGASGYLSKESNEAEFKKAVLKVLSGQIYLSDTIKDNRIAELMGHKAEVDKLSGLSNREIEVLTLMTKGLSTTQIAQTLNIRLNTVSTYKSNIYSKLNVSNLIELIEKVKMLD